jgi:aquaporin Z
LYAIAKGKVGYDIFQNGLGQNGYGDNSPGKYSLGACFTAEALLTGLFLFVIFGATSKKAPAGFAGIPVGITLVLIHVVGIPITGTSVNPARSLGPAVFVGGEALSQLWLFWVAPIIGGIIAAMLIFTPTDSRCSVKLRDVNWTPWSVLNIFG